MHTIGGFYKQTWWLWLLFVLLFAFLTYKVSLIFIVLIPGIILYSVYFGVVRVTELNEKEQKAHRA